MPESLFRSSAVRCLSLTLALAALGLGAAGSAWADRPADRPAIVAESTPDSGLPPLVDRDLFFGDPAIAAASLSPDGRFVSFVKPYNGVMNVWVKGIDEPFDAARPITADTERPVFVYFWSRDSRTVLYSQDKGGNENFRLYAVDPTAPPDPETGVPLARDLTPYDEVRAQIYALPERAPNVAIVGLNDRDPRVHDVYRLNLETGDRELLVKNDANLAGWEVDLDGNVRLGIRQTGDGGTELLKVSDGDLEPVYSCGFGETCYPLRFHRDGQRVYLEDNRGDGVDLSRLVLLDLASGQVELVESDPEGEVDFGSLVFSNATEEAIATSYLGDRLRVYAKDPEFAADLEFLRDRLPDRELRVSLETDDDRLAIVRATSDTDPGTVYLFDRDSRELTELYRVRPELDRDWLAPMQPIRYTARDGLEIPAYLTVPRGVPPENLPLVLMPHGGPWARDTWGYDAYAQFFANRGYAVLQPNFRGSTGYGKAFLNAGNGEWGTGFMQHDLTDGVKYLIEQGVVDGDRVAIFGGSYGGYAALAGLAFTPDLYAAGISFVGPSNLFTLIESIPPYWEPVRKLFTLRVGDPDDPGDRDRLRAQSPLFSASEIRAPLMVIQGANDPRVKQAESDQIVAAVRDLGRDVVYLLAPDEGHGFAREDNRLASVVAMERFLADHLGGRLQESVPDDIRVQLDAISVDVSEVEPPAASR